MAITDYLKRLNPLNYTFKTTPTEKRYYQYQNGQIYSVLGTAPNESGVAVDEQVSLTFSAVWAAVRILSESISSLPIQIIEEFANGQKLRIKSHPLNKVLTIEPNERMTAFSFFETAMLSLCLYGNSYAYINRTNSGDVASLDFLHPDDIDIKVYDDLIYYYCKSKGETYNSSEILHFCGLSNDGIKGMSPIQKAAENIGLGLAAQRYGARFFGAGGNPSGVLQTDKTLSDTAQQRLRDSFNANYGGIGNSNKTLVLEEGLEFKNISIPPDQCQFLSTRTFSIQEIARIFRVPPHMLADLTKSSFSNIIEQELEFVMHTLRPYAIRLESEMERKLLKETEKGSIQIRFNMEGLLRADPKTRAEFYREMVNNGIMSVNEVRQKEQLNAIEGGDKHLVQLNLTDIKNISDEKK